MSGTRSTWLRIKWNSLFFIKSLPPSKSCSSKSFTHVSALRCPLLPYGPYNYWKHPAGFPLFHWKKIQDFSRTFQDPHKNFSRTFMEPTNTWISRKMRKNNHLITLFKGMVHCSKQKLYTAWSTVVDISSSESIRHRMNIFTLSLLYIFTVFVYTQSQSTSFSVLGACCQ